MKRIILAALITVITVIGFSMYQQQDVGYLQIRFGEFAFESSLLVVLGALLVLMFVLSMLYHFVSSFINVFVQFGRRHQQRKQEKARQALSQGFIELAEGRFDKAEKILLAQVQYSDYPLLAYMGAARAAQQQGATDRRDQYLQLAHEVTPEADIAISLTQAEMQLARQQNEQALATLNVLSERVPKHTAVLRLFAQTCERLHDWDKVLDLLPELKKQQVLAAEEIVQLEIRAWSGVLRELAEDNNHEALLARWKALPKPLQAEAEVVMHYARALVHTEADGDAEQVLRQYLDKHWDEAVIEQYAELDVLGDGKQLEMAEKWLQQHPYNAHLLYALGKMCLHRSLWGKARSYFEASLGVEPRAQTYLKLARLLEEHMHDTEAAQEYYRQGLHLLAGQHIEARRLSRETSVVEADDAKPVLKIV